MNKTYSPINYLMLCVVVVSLLLTTTFAAASEPARYNSYAGLVMTGYQGWFNTPKDGADKGWAHYGRSNKFEHDYCTIDFWPDVSEYPKTYETSFKHADGTPARVFSSYDPSTVDVHFRWMQEYGIDGAFMQRFIHRFDKPEVKNHYDVVFGSAIRSAKKYGRAISIRYDLTHMNAGEHQFLLDDLDQLNAKYDFFGREEFPTFLHHKGKPLIAIGGIGFTDDVAGDDDVGYLNEAEIIIGELRKRGYSIMMRTSSKWRRQNSKTLVQEPEQLAKLYELIKSIDILMPWHTGSFRENTYVSSNWKQTIADDIKWCEEHGIEYVTTIFAGFSRANLKKGEDGSFRPRNRGSFYWLQASSAIDAGTKMFFVAQFDEMDEGTQIFKCTSKVPVGKTPFIAYEEEVGSDHYLWLTGQVGAMLRGDLPFTTQLPQRSP